MTSRAVTVTFKAMPAPLVAAAGVTLKCVAGSGAETAIDDVVPLINADTVSVAVIVRLPADFGVTENEPMPPDKAESAGNTAAGSVEVKWTRPP